MTTRRTSNGRPAASGATERQAAALRANQPPKEDGQARYDSARRAQATAQRKAATGDDLRGGVSSATIIQARSILERNGRVLVEEEDSDE